MSGMTEYERFNILEELLAKAYQAGLDDGEYFDGAPKEPKEYAKIITRHDSRCAHLINSLPTGGI